MAGAFEVFSQQPFEEQQSPTLTSPSSPNPFDSSLSLSRSRSTSLSKSHSLKGKRPLASPPISGLPTTPERPVQQAVAELHRTISPDPTTPPPAWERRKSFVRGASGSGSALPAVPAVLIGGVQQPAAGGVRARPGRSDSQGSISARLASPEEVDDQVQPTLLRPGRSGSGSSRRILNGLRMTSSRDSASASSASGSGSAGREQEEGGLMLTPSDDLEEQYGGEHYLPPPHALFASSTPHSSSSSVPSLESISGSSLNPKPRAFPAQPTSPPNRRHSAIAPATSQPDLSNPFRQSQERPLDTVRRLSRMMDGPAPLIQGQGQGRAVSAGGRGGAGMRKGSGLSGRQTPQGDGFVPMILGDESIWPTALPPPMPILTDPAAFGNPKKSKSTVSIPALTSRSRKSSHSASSPLEAGFPPIQDVKGKGNSKSMPGSPMATHATPYPPVSYNGDSSANSFGRRSHPNSPHGSQVNLTREYMAGLSSLRDRSGGYALAAVIGGASSGGGGYGIAAGFGPDGRSAGMMGQGGMQPSGEFGGLMMNGGRDRRSMEAYAYAYESQYQINRNSSKLSLPPQSSSDSTSASSVSIHAGQTPGNESPISAVTPSGSPLLNTSHNYASPPAPMSLERRPSPSPLSKATSPNGVIGLLDLNGPGQTLGEGTTTRVRSGSSPLANPPMTETPVVNGAKKSKKELAKEEKERGVVAAKAKADEVKLKAGEEKEAKRLAKVRKEEEKLRAKEDKKKAEEEKKRSKREGEERSLKEAEAKVRAKKDAEAATLLAAKKKKAEENRQKAEADEERERRRVAEESRVRVEREMQVEEQMRAAREAKALAAASTPTAAKPDEPPVVLNGSGPRSIVTDAPPAFPVSSSGESSPITPTAPSTTSNVSSQRMASTESSGSTVKPVSSVPTTSNILPGRRTDSPSRLPPPPPPPPPPPAVPQSPARVQNPVTPSKRRSMMPFMSRNRSDSPTKEVAAGIPFPKLTPPVPFGRGREESPTPTVATVANSIAPSTASTTVREKKSVWGNLRKKFSSSASVHSVEGTSIRESSPVPSEAAPKASAPVNGVESSSMTARPPRTSSIPFKDTPPSSPAVLEQAQAPPPVPKDQGHHHTVSAGSSLGFFSSNNHTRNSSVAGVRSIASDVRADDSSLEGDFASLGPASPQRNGVMPKEELRVVPPQPSFAVAAPMASPTRELPPVPVEEDDSQTTPVAISVPRMSTPIPTEWTPAHAPLPASISSISDVRRTSTDERAVSPVSVNRRASSSTERRVSLHGPRPQPGRMSTPPSSFPSPPATSSVGQEVSA